jgi:phytoene synthase
MSRNTNFYYSFLVLTPAKRRAIIAVWDFCRAIDDTVDDRAGDSETQRVEAFEGLAAWRKEIDAVFTPGVTPATPQGRALQPLARLFRLPRRPLEDLIDGVSMDIGFRRYRSFNELYQYCYKVASTVGLICVEIFGCREAASRDYAVDLGIALQLTNILRDVKGDLERGRLYIPLDELARFNCTEDTIRFQPRTEPVTALLRHQAARAREYYQRAARGLPRDDARRLVAAEIMGAIYRAILDEIELRDYDVFGEVVRIPDSQKVSLAFRSWIRIMTGRRVMLEPVRHG